MAKEIARFDIDTEQAKMVPHPVGEYVEFWDHHNIVGELRERIAALQTGVSEALQNLQSL